MKKAIAIVSVAAVLVTAMLSTRDKGVPVEPERRVTLRPSAPPPAAPQASSPLSAFVPDSPTAASPEAEADPPVMLSTPSISAAFQPEGVLMGSPDLRGWIAFSRGPYTSIEQRDDGAVTCVGHDGLVEIYEPRDDGIEQSFVIPERPEGDFVLGARLVSNLDAVVDETPGAGITFGDRLSYAKAVAVDADGQMLPLSIRYADRFVNISIPAEWLAAAAYPVILDPLIGSPQAVEPGAAVSSASETPPIFRLHGLAYNSAAQQYLTLWREDVAGLQRARFARLDSNGAQISAALTMPTPVASNQYGPQAAYAPSIGYYLAVYEEQVGAVRHVFGAFINADGTIAGAPFTIGDQAGFNLGPNLAFNPDANRWLVTWIVKPTIGTNGGTLYGRFVQTDGSMGAAIAMGSAWKIARVAYAGGKYLSVVLDYPPAFSARLIEDVTGAVLQATPLGGLAFKGGVDVAASPTGFLAVWGAAALEADVSLTIAFGGRVISADGTVGPLQTYAGPYNSASDPSYVTNPENSQRAGDMYPAVTYSAGAGEYFLVNSTVSSGGTYPTDSIRGYRIAADGAVLQPAAPAFPNDIFLVTGMFGYVEPAVIGGPTNQALLFYRDTASELRAQIVEVGPEANQNPDSPLQPVQRRSNGTAMAAGEEILVGQTVTFEAQIADPDAGQKIFAHFEVRPVAPSFLGYPTLETVIGDGGLVTATMTFTTAGDYSWQVRAKDEHGANSGWVEFTAASAISFKVVTAAETTPPVAGTVNDGTGADIDVQASATTLSANWSGFGDPESGIAGYEWAIGTTAGGTNIQAYAAVAGTSATNNALALGNGTTYYVTVRAANGVGLTVTATSDGVTVSIDSTAPIAGSVNDGTGADIDQQTSLTTISANWSGFSDPESGIASYEWAIGTTAGGTNIQAYAAVAGTSATNNALALANGTTYFVTVRATNGVGLTVTASSDGVTIVPPPPPPTEPDSSIATSGLYGPATYAGAIQGTASDASGSGLGVVDVRIQRQSDGQYWTGGGWGGAEAWSAAVGTTAWSYAFAPADGETYSLASRATDNNGTVESSPATTSFTYDATAPASVVQTGGSLTSASWPGAIEGTASDAVGGVTLVEISIVRLSDLQYWNGAVWDPAPAWAAASGTTNWSYPLLPSNGEQYLVESRATDAAGNVQAVYGQSTFDYNVSEPDSAVLTSGSLGASGWTGAIEGTAQTTNGATVTSVEIEVQDTDSGLYWDGAVWIVPATWVVASGTTGWSAPFAPAENVAYAVRSRATDSYGAVESSYGEASFQLDLTPPTVALTTAGRFPEASWPGMIQGTAADAGSGVAGVEVRVVRTSDGFTWDWAPAAGSGNWALALDPGAGTYQVAARATDLAGNLGAETSGTFAIEHDAGAPADPAISGSRGRVSSLCVLFSSNPDRASGLGFFLVLLAGLCVLAKQDR